MSQRRLGFVTASVAVAGFHSGRSFSKAEEEHRVHLCNNWWHRGLQSWKKACEVSVVPLHQAFIHHTDIMHLCVHPCLAKLWIMKACLFFSILPSFGVFRSCSRSRWSASTLMTHETVHLHPYFLCSPFWSQSPQSEFKEGFFFQCSSFLFFMGDYLN